MLICAFCMPQVPFAFEFESERPNFHLTAQEKLVKGSNGNSATVLSPNCHLATQSKTQTQTEPEVFRKHVDVIQIETKVLPLQTLFMEY